MLALLAQADLVIAPIQAPAHMANAMNTPIIGLYAHHNPERTGPYHYRNYVVTKYQEALLAETGKMPQKVDSRTLVKDPNAMQRITAQQVIAMFEHAAADIMATQVND